VQELHHLGAPAGPSNRWVREYLRLKSARGPEDVAPVEGVGLIEAALAHGASPVASLVCEALLRDDRGPALTHRIAATGAPTLSVSARTFARLTSRDGPDGLAMIARSPTVPLDELTVASPALVLVLDRLELPGNVGSLIRCASAAGAAGVIVTGASVRVTHPLVVRSSVGSVFSVPIATSSEGRALAWLSDERFQILGADPSAARSYRGFAYGPRTAMVLGSERFGLSARWRAAAHQLLSIRMEGKVDSLNAGHAGAVLMFEIAHAHRALVEQPPPS